MLDINGMMINIIYLFQKKSDQFPTSSVKAAGTSLKLLPIVTAKLLTEGANYSVHGH